MNTSEEKEAVQRLAKGESQESVAAVLGKNQSTISRFAKRNRALIEAEAERLVQALPDIIDQTIRDLKTGNNLSKALSASPKDSEEAAEAQAQMSPLLRNDKIFATFLKENNKLRENILKALGVLPSHAQSVVIQNIFHGNSQQVISPVVMKTVGSHIAAALKEEEEEAIDAEMVEEG